MFAGKSAFLQGGITLIEIYEETGDRWVHRELLLLADPDEGMVNRYLAQGFQLVARVDGQIAGEVVMVPAENGWELKNLARISESRSWPRIGGSGGRAGAGGGCLGRHRQLQPVGAPVL